MRKYLVIIVGIITIFCFAYTSLAAQETEYVKQVKQDELLKDALRLLKNRKDQDALVIFEKILTVQSDNLEALWGKAEVLRRSRNYKQAEDLLNKILSKNPGHASSWISLAYIKYKDDRLNEAKQLIIQAFEANYQDKENLALAYMMLGNINSKYAKKGWLFSKIKYGTQIKYYFLKAGELAPDLPEVHLALGTFYLLAPGIIGGNLNKAIEELELAVKIAPEFATACARLAQGYKKKGDLEKYNFYIKRTKELDPQNEVLKEID